MYSPEIAPLTPEFGTIAKSRSPIYSPEHTTVPTVTFTESWSVDTPLTEKVENFSMSNSFATPAKYERAFWLRVPLTPVPLEECARGDRKHTNALAKAKTERILVSIWTNDVFREFRLSG